MERSEPIRSLAPLDVSSSVCHSHIAQQTHTSINFQQIFSISTTSCFLWRHIQGPEVPPLPPGGLGGDDDDEDTYEEAEPYVADTTLSNTGMSYLFRTPLCDVIMNTRWSLSLSVTSTEKAESDSSHYESYGEEDDDDEEEEPVKDRAHYIQWSASQPCLRPAPESRLCGYLWRRKWLGQWTKQLFIIRNDVLLVRGTWTCVLRRVCVLPLSARRGRQTLVWLIVVCELNVTLCCYRVRLCVSVISVRRTCCPSWSWTCAAVSSSTSPSATGRSSTSSNWCRWAQRRWCWDTAASSRPTSGRRWGAAAAAATRVKNSATLCNFLPQCVFLTDIRGVGSFCAKTTSDCL